MIMPFAYGALTLLLLWLLMLVAASYRRHIPVSEQIAHMLYTIAHKMQALAEAYDAFVTTYRITRRYQYINLRCVEQPAPIIIKAGIYKPEILETGGTG